MKRRQWFEFTDLPWCPAFLRAFVTDYLQMIIHARQVFSPRIEFLARALQVTGQDRVIDLCSGGGGPWLDLAEQLEQHCGRPITVLLTDKYPSDTAAAKLPDVETIHYHREPVDALAVPTELTGVRTLFDGLHHFPPELATGILRDAVARRQGIAVFEMMQRTWLDAFLVGVVGFFSIFLFTPLVKPFSWLRLLLTYIVPIAPLVIAWDGLVSVLRCYTPGELEAMARSAASQANAADYCWHSGTYRKRGVGVTWLVGYPGENA